jgi:hypothetical protein
METLGCGKEDFVACKIATNPDDQFYMHLPQKSYDVVDVEWSSFLMVIPGNPPIPHHIQTLVLKTIPNQSLPACFRAVVPGHKQVFGELIVRSDLKKGWEENELTGAQFRQL